jgi:histidine decarboxylase
MTTQAVAAQITAGQLAEPVPFKLTDTDFFLPSPQMSDPHRQEKLSDEDRRERLLKLEQYLRYYQHHFLGYQVNQDLQGLDEDLAPFLSMHTNNVGDPYTDSNCATHTKWLERNILSYFAKLWRATPYRKENPESVWGYVLTMGSSEGNVYALLNARDYLSGKVLMVDRDPVVPTAGADGARSAVVPRLFLAQAEVPTSELHPDPKTDRTRKDNYYRPVAFFSEDTHYSVAKAAHTLAIPTFAEIGNSEYPGQCPITQHLTGKQKGVWPPEVPSTGRDTGPGTIDIGQLATLVEFFADKGHPIVVICNLGSTFKGAYDDVKAVADRLQPIFERHGLVDREVPLPPGSPQPISHRHGYWIHVDGALGASYLPFLRQAVKEQRLKNNSHNVPEFDFSIPQVSSIVTSGHKYPGSPWPCGIFMTRQKYQLKPPPDPAYIGSPDTTFAGSRNAFSAIVLWNHIAQNSVEDQIRGIVRCEEVADYAHHRLAKVDEDLVRQGRPGLELARTDFSLSLRFRMPRQEIVHKYSLAHVPLLTAGGVRKDFCHLYVMPHVTKALIDQLVAALMHEGAFPIVEQKPVDTHATLAEGWGRQHVYIDLARGFL